MEQNSNKNSDVSREIITRYGTIRRPNTSNIEINVISWNKGKITKNQSAKRNKAVDGCCDFCSCWSVVVIKRC